MCALPEPPAASPAAAWLPWSLLPPTAVWLGMTVLRESSLFWRNAGGYPVALRELVLDTYYPLTGLLLLGCALGAATALAGVTTLRRITAVGWLIVAVAVGSGLAYAGANNLANVMDGRPLHSHRASAPAE